LLAMLLVAQRTIINPISQLINFITRIRESGALDSQVKIDQSDEVGTLAHEFNHMLQRLSEAYAQLREQSYASGRAEMAAGVLHNIRNGLSPILGYSNNIRTQLAEVRLEGITTALRERDKEGIDSQRQAELQQYLALALQHSAKALKTASDNLVQLDRQVSLIERILVEQDIFSRQQTSLEVVNLSAALDEALKLMPLGAQEAITLHRDPSLASSEPVKVGRFGFVQALANLLNNSAQATVPGRAEPINVWVRAFRDSQDHRPMVVIEIKDDGQGIAPALLERVFERGFSTKGGSGLGLH
ncbi:MAG: ATP-binding protein, partial [Candidatus Zipacnadales bacterium]